MRPIAAICTIVCGGVFATAVAAEDAYVRNEANRWILGTSAMERVVALKNGKLLLKSFKNKSTGKELVSSGTASEEFFFRLGDAKELVTSSTGPWKLIRVEQTKLAQGELQLALTVQRESLQVTKYYILHPGSSIVRQWVTIKNAADRPIVVVDPGFLAETVRPGEPENLDFHWMTGGESQPGSWMLRTEKLALGKPHTFDSYESFHGGAGDYHYRMASGTYAPWYAMLAKDTREGVVIGWDYFGHWASSFRRNADGSVTAELKVAGHKQTLAPGQSLTTPKAFVGLFRNDLDEAGNEVLDWQYRYLWDYTRDGWFPAIRVVGYWMKGTSWEEPGFIMALGGHPDFDSTFRKIFSVADLMRRVGGDVYHRDWGWWDCAGDWNGPDFGATGKYLRKSGMGQLLYAFLYTVSPKSKVAQKHPDWLIEGAPWVVGQTLDMSKPEVVEFMKGQLDAFHDRWGDFEWRNDSWPNCPKNRDDTSLLEQDHGFRKILRDFLDKHQGCAFQAVNQGGNDAGYDYARFSSSVSYSDGGVGIIRNYYESLMLPPDKSSEIPDAWNPANYDKATWRGLLCINFDMTGETWEPTKLEGVRELIDIYHYLHRHGVVGRWVRVYRPIVAGDDPTMYFQRLSGDRLRGIIIPKRPAPGPLTIKPKGLLPDENYVVSFHEASDSANRTGKDLMQNGIKIEKMLTGELVYLNLPLHPGNKLDKEPPTPPKDFKKQWAENMGYPGVELTWKPGTDNNWVSCCDVFRNGKPLDRIAKGCYYFDHSAGADLAAKYEIHTVDGANNVSAGTVAEGPAAPPSTILDDVPSDSVKYAGAWQRHVGLLPAHDTTLSVSKDPKATVTVRFEGKRVLWFSKLDQNAGKAAVSIDGGPAEIVDTYSADDIWGVCVYRKEFASVGRHTLRISVLGQHSQRAKDSAIAIDGFRVER